MRRVISVGILLLLLGNQLLCAAEIVRGRWEKVEALKLGTGIVVRLKAGDRIEAAYLGLESEVLRVADSGGSEIKLPKASIRSVATAAKVRDRLANGTLIGAAAGGAAGFLSLLGFAAKATASGPIFDGEATGFFLSAGIVGGGIGAAVGALIDSRIKNPEMLYMSR